MKVKQMLGFLLIVAGIVLGVYVGVWVCFIGGIVGIIEAISAPELVAMTVALNVAKIFLAGVSGFLSAILLMIPGYAMIVGKR